MITSFWIHLLCLCVTYALTAKRREKKSTCKLVIVSLGCAVIDTILLVLIISFGGPEGNPVLLFGAAITELFLAARIVYGKQELMRNSVRLFCVTALLAGLFQLIPVKNVGLFCLAGTIFLPVLKGGIANVFRTKQTEKWMYEARLCKKNEEKCFSAFMDTGNRLRLYGSSLPVVLVDETYLNEWIKAAEYCEPQKLVFLPYKGVGGKGLLRGVRLQLMITFRDNVTISGEVAAVAAEHRLFCGCMYQMILQPEVLTMKRMEITREGVQNVI